MPTEESLLHSINRRLSDLDEDVNRIDRDLSGDRKDIEQLKIAQASIKSQLDSIMSLLTRFQIKTADAVKDAVIEANSPLQAQMKKFVQKKVVHIRPSKGIQEKFSEWIKKLKGGE